VDLSAVDAYSGVEVCTPIFLVEACKSFLKKKSKHNWTHPLTKLNTNKSCYVKKIIGSGRNVSVVEETFYFHLTLINLKIKVQ
jgi:hypothetical protein